MPRGTSEMGGRLPSFWSDSVRTTTSSGFTVAAVHPVKWKTPISHEDPHHPPAESHCGKGAIADSRQTRQPEPLFQPGIWFDSNFKNSIFTTYTGPAEKSTGVDNFFFELSCQYRSDGAEESAAATIFTLLRSRRIPVRRAAPPDSGRGRSRAPGSAAFAAAGAGSYDVRR